MKEIHAQVYGNVKVIEHDDYKWGVEDLEGNIIVPFGKYDWIDGFDSGLARVKIGKESNNKAHNENKWGVINEKGEEVLPVEYDRVWNFLGKNLFSITVEKDGVSSRILLSDLNPGLRVAEFHRHKDYDNYIYEREEHYEEFAGTYAQDVAGFSDEDINDAFDGEPDAYWNID